MNGMSYLCLDSLIFLSMSVRDTVLKEKLNLYFLRIVLILA